MSVVIHRNMAVWASVLILLGTETLLGSNDDEKTFIWTTHPSQKWPADAKTLGVVPPIFDNSGRSGGIIRSGPEAWYTVVMGELKTLFQRGLPQVKLVRTSARRSCPSNTKSWRTCAT